MPTKFEKWVETPSTDPSTGNVLPVADYLAEQKRIAGYSAGETISAKLLNTTLRQLSLFVQALYNKLCPNSDVTYMSTLLNVENALASGLTSFIDRLHSTSIDFDANWPNYIWTGPDIHAYTYETSGAKALYDAFAALDIPNRGSSTFVWRHSDGDVHEYSRLGIVSINTSLPGYSFRMFGENYVVYGYVSQTTSQIIKEWTTFGSSSVSTIQKNYLTLRLQDTTTPAYAEMFTFETENTP